MTTILIRPDPDPKSPGWRLRLERDDTGQVTSMAKLSEERVLPEKVRDPQANLTEPADCFWLRRDDAVWLRDALNTLLAGWPEAFCDNCGSELQPDQQQTVSYRPAPLVCWNKDCCAYRVPCLEVKR